MPKSIRVKRWLFELLCRIGLCRFSARNITNLGIEMKVIPPVEITDVAILAVAGVTEPHWARVAPAGYIAPPYPPMPSVYSDRTVANEWVSTVGYTKGAIVWLRDKWRIYQALVDVPINTAARPDVNTGAWADAGPYEILWSSGEVVAKGDLRIRRETHRTYIALRATNTGDTTPPEKAPTVWLDAGPTNAWAMFDQLRSTPTVVPRGTPPARYLFPFPGSDVPESCTDTDVAEIILFIRPPSRIDSVAISGVELKTLKLEQYTDTDFTPYWTATYGLSKRTVVSWMDYFFNPFRAVKAFVTSDVPLNASHRLGITLTNTGAPLRIGSLVLGRSVHLGDVEYGARASGENFSIIERDEYGNSLLQPRRTVPKFAGRLVATNDRANVVLDLREQLNAKPAVWVGLDKYPSSNYYESALILGIYKLFEVDMAHYTHARIDLEVEEI